MKIIIKRVLQRDEIFMFVSVFMFMFVSMLMFMFVSMFMFMFMFMFVSILILQRTKISDLT